MAAARTTRKSASPDTGNYHAHALARGLSLLETIADHGHAITLAEFHEATDLPKSTLVRLLSVLESAEYVVRTDERPAYRLGHRVQPLAQAYVAGLDISTVAAPYLRPLAAEIGQTANLGMLDGDAVLHVCVVPPERSLRFANMAGQRDTLHTTGLGKALLAALPTDQVPTRLPAEPYPAKTDKSKTTWAALQKDLRTISRRGYSLDDLENDIGVRCLAVPIEVDGRVVAAVSASGPAAEYTAQEQKRYLAALKRTAAELADDAEVTAALNHLFERLRS